MSDDPRYRAAFAAKNLTQDKFSVLKSAYCIGYKCIYLLSLSKSCLQAYRCCAQHIFSWAKAPALYVTMSQVEDEEEGHFLDLAFRAQIELRNVKVKVTLR